MIDVMTQKLEKVVKFRRQKTEQVIAEAVEIGLEKMWIDAVLAQYLKKIISRAKAVHLVGSDMVRLAEHQNRVVQTDAKWGKNGGKVHH